MGDQAQSLFSALRGSNLLNGPCFPCSLADPLSGRVLAIAPMLVVHQDYLACYLLWCGSSLCEQGLGCLPVPDFAQLALDVLCLLEDLFGRWRCSHRGSVADQTS
jgi:hypothetical protein